MTEGTASNVVSFYYQLLFIVSGSTNYVLLDDDLEHVYETYR